MKRKPVLVALVNVLMVLCTLQAIRCRDTFSSEETRLVGKWDIHSAADPDKFVSVTFTRDRRLSYATVVGLDSRWSAADGQLRIDHRYRMHLLPNAPPLPVIRKTESFYWKMRFTEDLDRIELESDGHLSDAILIRDVR